MATCNVQTLIKNAACFACLSPGEWEVLELQLLCEILNAGSSSVGSIQVLTTTDTNPNTATIKPANLTMGAIWYQDPAGGTGTNTWTWSVTNQNWSQIIV